MNLNKPGVAPYKLMAMLLWGVHKWMERDGATIRIPNAKMAKHMKIPVSRLQQYYYRLEDWGMLERVRWNKYWATVVVRPPVGMGVLYQGDGNHEQKIDPTIIEICDGRR